MRLAVSRPPQPSGCPEVAFQFQRASGRTRVERAEPTAGSWPAPNSKIRMPSRCERRAGFLDQASHDPHAVLAGKQRGRRLELAHFRLQRLAHRLSARMADWRRSGRTGPSMPRRGRRCMHWTRPASPWRATLRRATCQRLLGDVAGDDGRARKFPSQTNGHAAAAGAHVEDADGLRRARTARAPLQSATRFRAWASAPPA